MPDRPQNRALIVAYVRPNAKPEVAQIFAESDAGSLPRVLGVTERSLYYMPEPSGVEVARGDLYVHLVEFDRPVDEAMAAASQHPGFAEISERLRPHISPYDPNWRSPRDAVARLFYTYRGTG